MSPAELNNVDPQKLVLSGISSGGSRWDLLLGNALEKLREMPSESIQCIVTSPPYFWLRDYKIEGQIGLEDSIDDYVDNLCSVFEECFRILKKDGVLFLNLGDTYYSGRGESKGIDEKSKKRRFGVRAVDKGGGMGKGIKSKSILGMPWRVALKMIESGWILRSPIIWNRISCLPEAVKDRPLRQFEYLFLFAKSRKYIYNPSALEDSGEQDIWRIDVNSTTGGVNKLSAPFPLELAERCILIGSNEGDTILDPFNGSGTTSFAAVKNMRNAVGIDINEKFIDFASKRLQNL